MILTLLQQEKEGQEQGNMEVEMLKLENQQLRSDTQAQVVTAQINNRTAITKANIEAQIKAEELKFKYAELQQDGEAKGIELAQKAQKLADDYEKEVANMKIEGIKSLV
jgi:hypothetical protein